MRETKEWRVNEGTGDEEMSCGGLKEEMEAMEEVDQVAYGVSTQPMMMMRLMKLSELKLS